MLQRLGDHIADAHRRAAECEEAARNASDEESRINLEQMGKAWARSLWPALSVSSWTPIKMAGP
jgi:hypothetical protein